MGKHGLAIYRREEMEKKDEEEGKKRDGEEDTSHCRTKSLWLGVHLSMNNGCGE